VRQGGTVRTADYNFFFMKKDMKIIDREQDFWNTKVECVSERMSYIGLRVRWCNILVLNVHAPSKEKSDVSKDTFVGN